MPAKAGIQGSNACVRRFWIPALRFAPAGMTIAGLLLVTFLIAWVVPIDPVLAVVGDRASPEAYQRAQRDGGSYAAD